MPDQLSARPPDGRPSLGEAIARAEAAIGARAQIVAGAGPSASTSTSPLSARQKESAVHGPMLWRLVLLYAGSAALLAYSLEHMPQ
ncbi:hypothetical protein [Salinarimonas soli]|uniref:Uncharacterized protein n=1 Tax=Salinarimonas soli TaxID=1638099 RepID=A0A5B2VAX6_9HYPH|nr:hypothetical protein [Salinarimonas soli]KAA2235936.1 hypothetical protein F0L46_17380 [Salinarimonas soli]